jgi:hypothetical protein
MITAERRAKDKKAKLEKQAALQITCITVAVVFSYFLFSGLRNRWIQSKNRHQYPPAKAASRRQSTKEDSDRKRSETIRLE